MTSDAYTYAREAERCLSWLADKTGDEPEQAIAAGLAAIANALLSVDDAIRSAAIDIPNAVSDLSDRVADVEEAIGAASDRAARPRPWWRGASREDRTAYREARGRLAALGADVYGAEFEAANHAVIVAGARLPWWQR